MGEIVLDWMSKNSPRTSVKDQWIGLDYGRDSVGMDVR